MSKPGDGTAGRLDDDPAVGLTSDAAQTLIQPMPGFRA
jgi:hypothetical protein